MACHVTTPCARIADLRGEPGVVAAVLLGLLTAKQFGLKCDLEFLSTSQHIPFGLARVGPGAVCRRQGGVSVWGWGTTKLGREAIGLQQLPLRVPARQDTGLQTLASSCTLSPASACRRLRQQAGQCMQFVAARKRTTAIVNVGVGSSPEMQGASASRA